MKQVPSLDLKRTEIEDNIRQHRPRYELQKLGRSAGRGGRGGMALESEMEPSETWFTPSKFTSDYASTNSQQNAANLVSPFLTNKNASTIDKFDSFSISSSSEHTYSSYTNLDSGSELGSDNENELDNYDEETGDKRCDVYDFDNKSTSDNSLSGHIIVPFADLHHLLTRNLRCNCGKREAKVIRQTLGIATSVTYVCNGCKSNFIMNPLTTTKVGCVLCVSTVVLMIQFVIAIPITRYGRYSKLYCVIAMLISYYICYYR